MSRLDKAYYALDEVEARWRLPRRDVVYLAENGLLRLSVRLYGVHLECGTIEEMGDGRRLPLAAERLWFTGLQDLLDCDAHRLFREGQVTVGRFAAPAGEYCWLIEPTDEVAIHLSDVVVRKEERERVEAEQGLGSPDPAPGAELSERNDYAEVRLGGRTYLLGPLQARVVKHLHAAARAGRPWCFGKLVLAEVGSASSRMADVFKSQREWRRLIESDRRGRYRLKLPGR